jgi:hypothetical protein
MTHHTKPWFVLAMHRIDGQVLLGEFDTEAERDRLFHTEHKAWRNGGMCPDVVDICRGELGRMPGRSNGAEEADMAMALMAQYDNGQQTRKSRKATRNEL